MKNITLEQKKARKDLDIILLATLIPLIIYVGFSSRLMEYINSSSLLIGLIIVAFIQFGLTGLGMTIVMIKNGESFKKYGLVKNNTFKSCIFSLLFCIPAFLFLLYNGEINSFFPFQGMFLTRRILESAFPFNILGYIVVAMIWGFFEGINYIVIADKINKSYKTNGIINLGAALCGIVAILIHGMIGTDFNTIIEAITTFILIYGMIITKEKTGNAWGSILIFFIFWNAF